MTRKTDYIKLNRLHQVKKRRMQKFHARKLIRAYAPYVDKNDFWLLTTRLFLNNQLHGRVRLDFVLP